MRLENIDDGSKLQLAWAETLKTAVGYFRALHASSTSSSWKPVQVPLITGANGLPESGQSSRSSSTLSRISAENVVVHRRSGKLGEVYRAVVEMDCGPDINVDSFRGSLVTPQTRPVWDRMVEEAEVVELLDPSTRVTRTKYRLGWPSNPRDAVTISKTLMNQQTIIDISTSLPRSKHEPAYLRPAPPHVRAHVALLAWCVQVGGAEVPAGKARITCFWSWNPKGTWAAGGGVPQHLPLCLVGLVDHVRSGSERVPVLLNYGSDISIGGVDYDTARVTLSVGYAIIKDTETERSRQIEFGVSSSESWDVQVHAKTQTGQEPSWSSFVGRAPTVTPGAPPPKRLVFRLTHGALDPNDELVRVKVSIERTSSSGTPSVRINGIVVGVERMSVRSDRRPLLEETTSSSALSLNTISTAQSEEPSVEVPQPDYGDRSPAAEKSIASLVRRNYIYFTSLLQEPEAKWKPVLDSRGIAIHQLDSIDKTLVVYRAEAVFVGVGIWDLYATIASGGRSVEQATLLEDVNELTDLWLFQTKAAWPVAARDSILLRTTYKSPSSVHIFGFSSDNTDLFPSIPPSLDANVIRTQIDLQGWSIESLSPNTTQVTLLEQSDPRGWSNKSSIPQVMMTSLAGIGDFAIKHGAPPIATRLAGAKALGSRFEDEVYRFEYQSAEARRSASSSTATAFPFPSSASTSNGDATPTPAKPLPDHIECEIRCDADTWSNSFAITIEPPQYGISALKRSRLSPQGGGLWLTIEHDPNVTEKISVVIARGPQTPKLSIVVNEQKIKVDIEELSEAEVNLLKKQKRSRPTRAPLDQPASLGSLRKVQSLEMSTPSSRYAKIASPIKQLYSYASESTRAAIIPMSSTSPTPAPGDAPVDAAVRALSQLIRIHSDRDGESTDPDGWQAVSERDGLRIEKRLISHVSDTFPVYRAGRIIEGFTAEEISALVSLPEKDERFDRPEWLQSFGQGMTVSHQTAYTSFPFRSRSVLLASVISRMANGPPPTPTASDRSPLSTIFHASSSSFDPQVLEADASKYNPTNLPSAHVLLEGWILETIDPYSHEQYPIPSTRCMYVASVDYSGSLPLSVNNILNSALPRVVLTIENKLKTRGAPSRPRLPPMCVTAPESSSEAPWSIQGESTRIGMLQTSEARGGFTMSIILQPTARSMISLRHNDSQLSVQSRSTVQLGESPRDLVVTEIELAASFAAAGCDIQTLAVSLPVAENVLGPCLPFSLPRETVDLPFNISIVELSPTLSLDPGSQTRHLLRITLPTSGYEAPVHDPLSSRASPLPRPRWLLDLINDGAVVQIRLKPRLSHGYRYNLRDIQVEDDASVTSASPSLPRLVDRDTPESRSLARPLAVAEDLLLESAFTALRDDTTEKASEVGSVREPPPAKEPPPPKRPSPIPDRRLSFWRYSRFSHFATPITTPVKVGPSPLEKVIQGTDPSSSTNAFTEQLFRPVVSWPGLVLACLVCLLLGSLLRSILSEADFVVYLPDGQAASPSTSTETWRELRRLIEWRIGRKRDLILAIARRR
ncbi:hypothetical protein BD324DRAFT_628256 [Kockovaella imperatae]|uniref:START domain-containing protein n=1 Tax=Kockovaella imperatae TaxID=4999 RepID=A0A1Y1UE90_9TREE|nr:hypothetical protein BD324DRAFT_628256 [Kockovaella imperatae]ORX36309.1 hypothetical protein BD324DRAFT_628256 [Kockovaella imperatae]